MITGKYNQKETESQRMKNEMEIDKEKNWSKKNQIRVWRDKSNKGKEYKRILMEKHLRRKTPRNKSNKGKETRRIRKNYI